MKTYCQNVKGNSTITDQKLPELESGLLTNYQSDITQESRYYPFGMLMDFGDSGIYRFGFQNWEKDDEIKGIGNHLSFGDYGYDPRLGRRWNIDPLASKYPDLSPYHFTGNNPIRFVDFDGEDFGVKINHTDETIVIVANVYTTSAKAYRQALKSAGAWNTKSATVDGYTVSFQVKVEKPQYATDEQAIKRDPSIVKNNGKYKKGKLARTKRDLTYKMAQGFITRDDIGNLYSGNSGDYSEDVSGYKFVGGITVNGVIINMNTHSEYGDMGTYEDFVTHELGHLFGLDDEGKGEYFSDDGIMKYKGLNLNPISDNDVKNILDFAKSALEGKTKSTDAKVKLLENIGNSVGSNPLGVKNEEKE